MEYIYCEIDWRIFALKNHNVAGHPLDTENCVNNLGIETTGAESPAYWNRWGMALNNEHCAFGQSGLCVSHSQSCDPAPPGRGRGWGHDSRADEGRAGDGRQARTGPSRGRISARDGGVHGRTGIPPAGDEVGCLPRHWTGDGSMSG